MKKNESFQEYAKTVSAETYTPEHFGDGFCAADNLFIRKLHEFVRKENNVSRDKKKDPEIQMLREDLVAGLDKNLRFKNAYGDSTIRDRWKALSAIARAMLLGKSNSEYGTELRKAKESFAVTNRIQRIAETNTESIAIPEDDLFHEALCDPWNSASWMIWDALSQINDDKLIASESTWLLTAPAGGGGGTGAAWQIVVQAVPGPQGLVVPNWWQLGLLPFPISEPDTMTSLEAPPVSKQPPFVPAIQEALSWAARGYPNRLRWHLTRPNLSVLSGEWWRGISGRSGMAAAFVVGQALCKKIENEKSTLQEDTAITAEMHQNGVLLSVDRLDAKLKAARATGKIKYIFVADNQEGIKSGEHHGIHVESAESITDYLRKSNLEDVFDNYREMQRQNFEYLEPTSTPQ